MTTFTPFEQWLRTQAQSGELPDTAVLRIDGTMIVGKLSRAQIRQVTDAIPQADQQRAARTGALVVYNTQKHAVRIVEPRTNQPLNKLTARQFSEHPEMPLFIFKDEKGLYRMTGERNRIRIDMSRVEMLKFYGRFLYNSVGEQMRRCV